MSEINDISQPNPGNGKGKLSEAQLLAYLEGRLSAEEQHNVEQWLANEGMESDALEGLQELPIEETRNTVGRINYQLQKDLHKKRKHRKYITDNRWAWLAIVIVLLLTVLGYIVIRMMVKI